MDLIPGDRHTEAKALIGKLILETQLVQYRVARGMATAAWEAGEIPQYNALAKVATLIQPKGHL